MQCNATCSAKYRAPRRPAGARTGRGALREQQHCRGVTRNSSKELPDLIIWASTSGGAWEFPALQTYTGATASIDKHRIQKDPSGNLLIDLFCLGKARHGNVYRLGAGLNRHFKICNLTHYPLCYLTIFPAAALRKLTVHMEKASISL